MKKEAKRYNKSYPGEMLHLDCKRLPLLKGQVDTTPRGYLFVAIDDYSRELYAAILPDKTVASDRRPDILERVRNGNSGASAARSSGDLGRESTGQSPLHQLSVPDFSYRYSLAGFASRLRGLEEHAPDFE